MSAEAQRTRWREEKARQRADGRGVDTRPIEVRRERWRKAASKRRLRAQNLAALHEGCCQVKRNGSGKICGQKLVARHDRDRFGVILRTIYDCPSCERRRAGICQCCDNPVAGRKGFALYCDAAECKRRVRKAYRFGLDPRALRC